ncbi:trans-sialidase, putative [Trypanosoma cruzi marinkellei]|uniref:Trans-sialidase, putative n=1 Tax=Trypanosoma cruzi marinkellei TaxID=85056 RepID=K2PB12_TRYCR|nr:trans-sialidase, putative [Trypanosoma cruzi marinkellei]
MLSRVAAVKTPRTHNGRRVTGSSGRRREGGESEPQRPNISRRVFASAVLLFFVVCSGSGAAHAVEGKSEDAQLPNEVAIFVPDKTRVKPKNGIGLSTMRDSFTAPSLVRAVGVMIAFAGGGTKYKGPHNTSIGLASFNIVAGYVTPAETWSSIVDELNKDTWRALTVLSMADEEERVGVAFNPTSIAKGNKVFLVVGIYEERYDKDKKSWMTGEPDIQLVVGKATQSTGGEQSKKFSWSLPTSLLKEITPEKKSELKMFSPGGGAGLLMENGTLVFPLEVVKKNGDIFSMIVYSTDNGENWVFPEGISSSDCFDPRIAEWKRGRILMVTFCGNENIVYESLDMGTTWTKAVGTLPGVWVNARSTLFWDESLRVGALITATIEVKKLMLYTQRGYVSGEKNAIALYLWVTDNKRSFHVGPVAMDSDTNKTFASSLLYSGGNLHLLQERGNEESKAILLARLTEELNKIKSILKNWAQLDASFFTSFTPTVGLVGFLSNAASGDMWIDDYRCVNANVMNALKVKNGFRFTGSRSGAIWPVNIREKNGPYTFVNYDFTIVATVIIHKVPKLSTPLLGAVLDEPVKTNFIGLSYNTDRKWETVFYGIKTAQDGNWEPGREYQVALMLQDGRKGSVYVNAELVGSSETMPSYEEMFSYVSHFQIGGDEGDSDSSMTVKNVFLYNRPLSADEIKMVKKSDGSMRAGVSRVLLLLLLGLWGIAALY